MKGDVWYLKDRNDNDRILAKFEVTSDFGEGNCWEAIAWHCNDNQDVIEWKFVTEVYLKHDSCSHWWFNGEGYDSTDKTHDDIDAYYHLCGPNCVADHIRFMCFVWKIAPLVLTDNQSKDSPWEIASLYREDETLNNIIKIMLDGCKIEKEEPNETKRIP